MENKSPIPFEQRSFFKRRGTPVMVEWYDSHHRPGWTTEEPSQYSLICFSVGWAIFQNEKILVLSPNITDEEDQQRCGDMTIPVCSIRSINHLEIPCGIKKEPPLDSREMTED